MKFTIPFLLATSLYFLSFNTIASIPKMLYGEDGRYEVDDFKVIPYRPYTDAVAGMVNKESLADKGQFFQFYKVRLTDTGLPTSIPYSRQLVLPDCSGFLVADDIIVTAGHCITSTKDCRDNLWVFDYTYKNSQKTRIDKKNAVQCKKILKRAFDDDGWVDYAVIQLDRKITDRPALTFRKEGEVTKGTKVMMIGHPLGLPMKITIGAQVWHTDDQWVFTANLDAFSGNSGSPVLDQETGMVEGILVRGGEDFIDQEDGTTTLNICTEADNSELCVLGEDITRITKLGLEEIIQKAREE